LTPRRGSWPAGTFGCYAIRIPQSTLEGVPSGAKSLENLLASDGQQVRARKYTEKNDCLKLKDRCGYVSENKGSVFWEPVQSGNVVENKSSYAQKAVMLLKTNEVGGRRGMKSKC
jgi:hypothetical protein